MFSEGNAAHPVGCDSSLQIVIAVWGTFLNLNFPDQLFGALQILKNSPNDHY
jgi:hypothetical protein